MKFKEIFGLEKGDLILSCGSTEESLKTETYLQMWVSIYPGSHQSGDVAMEDRLSEDDIHNVLDTFGSSSRLEAATLPGLYGWFIDPKVVEQGRVTKQEVA